MISCFLLCVSERDSQPPSERRRIHRGRRPDGDGTFHVRPSGHGHPHWREGTGPLFSCDRPKKDELCNGVSDICVIEVPTVLNISVRVVSCRLTSTS